MKTGVLKTYNSNKGFGMVSPNDGSEDVFLHCSAVVGSNFKALNVGDKVAFQVVQIGNRREAANVTLINSCI